MKTKKPYPPLTSLHLEVLTLMGSGMVPGDIGPQIKYNREKTQNLIREACQRAGIPKNPRRGYWQEMEAAKRFMDFYHWREQCQRREMALRDPMF